MIAVNQSRVIEMKDDSAFMLYYRVLLFQTMIHSFPDNHCHWYIRVLRSNHIKVIVATDIAVIAIKLVEVLKILIKGTPNPRFLISEEISPGSSNSCLSWFLLPSKDNDPR